MLVIFIFFEQNSNTCQRKRIDFQCVIFCARITLFYKDKSTCPSIASCRIFVFISILLSSIVTSRPNNDFIIFYLCFLLILFNFLYGLKHLEEVSATRLL